MSIFISRFFIWTLQKVMIFPAPVPPVSDHPHCQRDERVKWCCKKEYHKSFPTPLCKRITREILSVAPRRQHPSFFRVLGSPTAYFLYSMETIRDTPHYFLFLPIQTNFLLRELHLSIFSLASCSVFIPWLDWKSRSTVDWYKRAIFIHLQFVKFWFLFVFCTKGWIFSGGQRLLGSFPKSNTSSFTFS